MNVLKRFLGHVERNDAGCWLWTGSHGVNGYGQFGFNGKTARAHRVSWQLHVGEIPNGSFVLHRCDIRHCVNPAHLFLGTAKDNTADMIQKNRHNFGLRKSRLKLSTEQISKILTLYAAGGVSTRALAERFGVSHATIQSAIKGKHANHPGI